MKILIFGTGKYYQNRKKSFQDVEVIGFLDNSESKIGYKLDGKKIFHPKQVQEFEYDYVCIMTSKYCRTVYTQLIECGVEKEKILSYAQYMDVRGNGGVQLFYSNKSRNDNQDGKKVLVFSHELSNTGAPLVLYNAVRVLQKHGYNVSLLSLQDGPLRKEYVDAGVNVWIKETISERDEVLIDWVNSFDLLFMCTLVFGEFIRNTKDMLSKPILWWLHESEAFYEAWWEQCDPRPLPENISIYNVGPRALQTYKKYFETEDGNILLYGGTTEKVLFKQQLQNNKKATIFLVAGLVQPRKGQDIVIDALRYLSEEEKEKLEIWFVGAIAGIYPEYEQKFELEANRESAVRYIGELEHEKYLELMRNADVLLCPSRDDPLPVVVAEAMMYGKPCIVSENTGFAYYIKQYINGVICKAEAESISNGMKWVLENKECLKDIGAKGKQLYQKMFSSEAFETSLLEAVSRTMLKQ